MNTTKMPTECGRYEWDGDPVTVYWSGGELMANNGCMVETVEEFDWYFRNALRIEGRDCQDAWVKVGACCQDDCDGECHKPNPIIEALRAMGILGITTDTLLDRIALELQRGDRAAAREQLAFVDRLLAEKSRPCIECGGCGFLEDFATMNITGQCPECNGSRIEPARKPR